MHYLCEKLKVMPTDTTDYSKIDPSLLDFRKSEQLISKPTDDNDDYEEEYTDSY